MICHYHLREGKIVFRPPISHLFPMNIVKFITCLHLFSRSLAIELDSLAIEFDKEKNHEG